MTGQTGWTRWTAWAIGLITLIVLISLWPQKEGFNRRFFNKMMTTYFIGLDRSQFEGNALTMVYKINDILDFDLNAVMIEDIVTRYQRLIDNQIQFILARAHELHNIIYKKIPEFSSINVDNLRYVATLFTLPVNIITSNSKIMDFADLKDSGLTVNIGPKNTGDYYIGIDLLYRYDLVDGRDIKITNYSGPDLFKYYGNGVDVVIQANTHPNRLLSQLISKTRTRFVETQLINNGNIYNVSPDEANFYNKYPYYHKHVLSKTDLTNYYPRLATYEKNFSPEVEKPIVVDQDETVSTISMNYYLISNKFTDPQLILHMLYKIKLNMTQLNQLEFIESPITSVKFADFTLPLRIHSGTAEFNRRSGLYTNLSDPQCALINGRCTREKLLAHRLDLGAPPP